MCSWDNSAWYQISWAAHWSNQPDLISRDVHGSIGFITVFVQGNFSLFCHRSWFTGNADKTTFSCHSVRFNSESIFVSLIFLFRTVFDCVKEIHFVLNILNHFFVVHAILFVCFRHAQPSMMTMLHSSILMPIKSSKIASKRCMTTTTPKPRWCQPDSGLSCWMLWARYSVGQPPKEWDTHSLICGNSTVTTSKPIWRPTAKIASDIFSGWEHMS